MVLWNIDTITIGEKIDVTVQVTQEVAGQDLNTDLTPDPHLQSHVNIPFI